LKVKKQGDETFVYPEGRIDIATAGEFKDTMLSLMEEGNNRICLDFSQVTAIDSSGLGKLLMFQKKLKEQNGHLRIVNVKSEYVKKIFSLVHLYKVVEIEGMES